MIYHVLNIVPFLTKVYFIKDNKSLE